MKEQLNGKPSSPPSLDGPATPERLEALRREAERLDIPELAEVEPTANGASWLLTTAAGSKPGSVGARLVRKRAQALAASRAEAVAA
jgi:hypothetical protein